MEIFRENAGVPQCGIRAPVFLSLTASEGLSGNAEGFGDPR